MSGLDPAFPGKNDLDWSAMSGDVEQDEVMTPAEMLAAGSPGGERVSIFQADDEPDDAPRVLQFVNDDLPIGFVQAHGPVQFRDVTFYRDSRGLLVVSGGAR